MRGNKDKNDDSAQIVVAFIIKEIIYLSMSLFYDSVPLFVFIFVILSPLTALFFLYPV